VSLLLIFILFTPATIRTSADGNIFPSLMSIMERHTPRITRRKSTRMDQEPPTARSWLDANNGIFIQRKPQAHVKNEWDDDFQLVLSQVSQAMGGTSGIR
jgi:hypothetical protein